MADNELIAEIPNEPPIAGLLAEFTSAEALRAAAEEVRDAGYTRWDAHSPFPVHGIERAMGMRPTVLPWLVLGAGLFGAAAAVFLQWWTNATGFDTPLPNALRGYPWIISGKPLFSLPANIPIVFEVIVLLSALTAFFGVFLLCRLPQYRHPVFSSRRFRRATTDRFFLAIDAGDAKFDAAATRQLLEATDAEQVEVCRGEAVASMPPAVRLGLVTLAILAMVPLVLVAQYRSMQKREPRIHAIQDMDFQAKYKAQTTSPLFDDGRAARLPAAGTVVRGELRADEHFYQGKVGDDWAVEFPEQLAINRATALRGRQRYEIFCATCHGLSGGGDGITSLRAQQRMDPNWATPVSLHAAAVRQQAVGQIFHTIGNGVLRENMDYRTMPGYAAQIPPRDRWAIVLYVRALQRSRNATLEDVPEDIRPQLR